MTRARDDRGDLAAGAAPALLAWYGTAARDLPWRRTRDPYHILVSEFMLQQTQVQTVIPYYTAFLARFPDAGALAAATPDEVLAVWQGLGYYRRARHLHAAACEIVARHGGRLPASYDAVRALPGIGEYTAAAVLSIAFDLPYPVLDGNVLRVMARLLCLDEPVDKGAARRRIRAALERMMPRERCGDFNQALMELGATVCTPSSPRCDACPVAGLCAARAAGRVHELPRRAAKEPVREEERTVVVVRLGGRVLLRRRPEEGLLAGLWEFPHCLGAGEAVAEKLARAVVAGAQLRADGPASEGGAGGTRRAAVRVRSLGRVEHRFSHLVWRLHVYTAELVGGVSGEEAGYAGNAGGGVAGAGEAAAAWDASGDDPASWAGTPVPAVREWTAAPPGGEPGARWVAEEEIGNLALPRAMQRVWSLACGAAPEPAAERVSGRAPGQGRRRGRTTRGTG